MNKLIILYNKFCTISDKIRFLIIGCLNAGISYIIFALSLFLIGQEYYQLCVVLQWVLSSPISYLNQKFFVFCTKGNYIKEYLKCCSSWAISYVLNAIILELLMKYAWENAYFEQIVSTFIVAIATYVLFKYFAFGKKKEGQSMYIINADDYGISDENNKAILEAAEFGLLNSTSVMVNTPFCNYEILNKLLQQPNFRIGLHLNIFEFKSMQKDLNTNSKLYDKNGEFHNSFIQVLKNSFDKEYLQDVEKEYRLQIEEALKHFKPAHIDSHVHMHAIPNLFKIVCKLAKEYNIPYIRTQWERPQIIPSFKMFRINNLINLIKVALLDLFTIINKFELKKYDLKTNDYIVGVQFTGNMNSETLYYGYLYNHKRNKITEALLHPTKNKSHESNYLEYVSLFDEKLLNKLKKYLIKY